MARVRTEEARGVRAGRVEREAIYRGIVGTTRKEAKNLEKEKERTRQKEGKP